ncbi:MAG: hypothetical protein KJ798_05095 [Gammaproteobacteria bacterium]|uniref:hypothetical protein n=1 Tax=Limnobacter sp. TaxID=2003368 RepID=UPI001D6F8D85|nr:hypothetical protein [Limnobacter sp.]MBU0784074.1 hypothetical protein [Gammaproteobacteria bacterium]MDZ4296930.1 hypothetical protein [Moraxellaceae bacterium]MBU0849812.1 hypothetical protein [Gammaproteobacteria bacterium]MBU1266902.1 hypothetical protein [Gammaproteobacteria bacterium]MBU1779742.1 hypothetical protein [Gammaproteobacteria bacterium]
MSVSGIQQQLRVTKVDAEEAIRSGTLSRVDQRRSVAQSIVDKHAGRSKSSQATQSVGTYLASQAKATKKEVVTNAGTQVDRKELSDAVASSGRQTAKRKVLSENKKAFQAMLGTLVGDDMVDLLVADLIKGVVTGKHSGAKIDQLAGITMRQKILMKFSILKTVVANPGVYGLPEDALEKVQGMANILYVKNRRFIDQQMMVLGASERLKESAGLSFRDTARIFQNYDYAEDLLNLVKTIKTKGGGDPVAFLKFLASEVYTMLAREKTTSASSATSHRLSMLSVKAGQIKFLIKGMSLLNSINEACQRPNIREKMPPVTEVLADLIGCIVDPSKSASLKLQKQIQVLSPLPAQIYSNLLRKCVMMPSSPFRQISNPKGDAAIYRGLFEVLNKTHADLKVEQ